MKLSDYIYHEEPAGKIYCGDCLEILPLLEPVDLVLTDPPYGMKFVSNHRNIKYAPIIGDESFPIDAFNLFFDMALRAVYVFCRWDNLAELRKPKSVIAWIKNNWSMGDLLHEHGRQWEAICFYDKPNHEFIKRIPDVIYADRTGNKCHPTEKPVSALKQIISANRGDTILDPFLGSGTTAVAAKQLGRKFIGIEISEKYCEIAKQRLAQEELF